LLHRKEADISFIKTYFCNNRYFGKWSSNRIGKQNVRAFVIEDYPNLRWGDWQKINKWYEIGCR